MEELYSSVEHYIHTISTILYTLYYYFGNIGSGSGLALYRATQSRARTSVGSGSGLTLHETMPTGSYIYTKPGNIIHTPSGHFYQLLQTNNARYAHKMI